MSAWEALKLMTAQLSTAATIEDVGQSLLTLAKRFGCTNVAIVEAGGVAGQDDRSVVFASSDRLLSPEFSGPGITSLTFLHARSTDEPFLLSQALHQGGPNHGDSEVVWTENASQRHKEGLVVPIYDRGELAWFVVFTGEDIEFMQPARSVLSAAAHAAIGRQMEYTQRPATGGVFLSQREYECLRWVADGKTDAEVGQILNITARTVRFHIRNAKEKLGVTTRIQAVAMRARGSVSCGRRAKSA